MIRFSNSSLGVYEECPRCFWLAQHHKIARPRGIFPSLPGGIDRVLKVYFDNHMSQGTLPPEMADLAGAMPYPDRAQLNKWRNWRNLTIDVDGIAELSGALDELIVWPDGLHSPYDYKTRGAAPVEGASEEYYGTQLDIYHLLIEEGCDLRCNGDGYLGYYWPANVSGHGDIKFNTAVVKLKTDPSRAVKLVHDAMDCLAGPIPMAHSKCEYCTHHEARSDHGKSLEKAAV